MYNILFHLDGKMCMYSKTSISGPSEERTPPLERTDQLPPIELTIILIHLKPPKADASELRRADTRGVTNVAQPVQIYLRKRTSSAAPTLNKHKILYFARFPLSYAFIDAPVLRRQSVDQSAKCNGRLRLNRQLSRIEEAEIEDDDQGETI